ncbi:MAG TPA: hypothetical protein VNG93_14660 [Candidatus Dormibacteraeota bacterium]|nr:hypothetical protein [Candidatus Dormibacteraeota bacterium]
MILLQCLSFGQVAAAPLVRSWSGAGAGVGRSVLSRASGPARSLVGRARARAAQVVPALARTRPEPAKVKDDAN